MRREVYALKYCVQLLAYLALFMTTAISNSTCHYIVFQEKMPDDAKKLRKF